MCASGLLMSALALALILTDIYHDRINYITEHAILEELFQFFFSQCVVTAMR